MYTLVLATGNHHKLKELQTGLQALPITFQSLKDFPAMPEPLENGQTLAENAALKATYYARLTALPCLADDTGLMVEALDQAPGIHTARFAGPQASGHDNCQKLLHLMNGMTQRAATFHCTLALAKPSGCLHYWHGHCAGSILPHPQGQSDFGYDPLFYCLEAKKTLAEMTSKEIQAVGHRGQALARFIQDWAETERWLSLH